MSTTETTETTEKTDTTAPEPAKKKSRLWKLLLVLLCLLVAAWTQRERLAMLPNSMARRALARRDDDGAVKWLRISKRISNRNAEGEFLLGRLARRQGRMDDAERHLRRAAILGFDDELLQRERWLAAAQSGQMSTAEPHLTTLLQNPMGDGAEICEAYVIGYLRMRRFAPAMDLIEAWMEDFPDDAQPSFWAGQVYRDLHSIIKAEKYFRQALEKDPAHYQAALGLADVLMAGKKSLQAVEYFRLAQQDEQQRTEASLGLAQCLRSAGETAEAEKILDELIRAEPANTEALVQQANLEIEMGNYAAAEKRLRPLVQREPGNRELRFTYGTALRGLDRGDEAQAHFDYANTARAKITLANDLSAQVVDRPKDAQLRYEVGKLFMDYGSAQEGLIWLHSVLEFDPQHQGALRALADYYEQRAQDNPTFAALALRYRTLIRDDLASDPDPGQDAPP